LIRDDGAVVYLNGREVARSNMPAGSIDYNTAASSDVEGVNEDTLYVFDIDGSDLDLLQTGTNVIAVEVHQYQPANTDLAFNMILKAAFDTDTD
jgi:hypothetical protein